MAHRPNDLAPRSLNRSGAIGFQIFAERIVGGNEEPALAARLRQRFAEARTQGVGIVGPVNEIAGAFRAGHDRGPRPRSDGPLVLLLRYRDHRERDRRIGQVHDDVDILRIEPLPRDRRPDVGLVLMISRDDFDRYAQRLREVIDSELSSDDGAYALIVGVDARHVVEDADLERPRRLRANNAWRQRQRRASDQDFSSIWPYSGAHSVLSAMFPLRAYLPGPGPTNCGASPRARQVGIRET